MPQINSPQVYSESTQRDNISSQRQLASSRTGSGVGTIHRQVVNLGVQDRPDEEAHQSGGEEIILASEEFEDATEYHKIRLALGILLAVILLIGSTLLLWYNLNQINIFAIFICIMYTTAAVLCYLFVIMPIWLIIVSSLFLTKSRWCYFFQIVLVTKETTLILIKGNLIFLRQIY